MLKKKVELIKTHSRKSFVKSQGKRTRKRLVKEYKHLGLKWISSKSLTHSMVGIVDNTVLYNSNLLRVLTCSVLPNNINDNKIYMYIYEVIIVLIKTRIGIPSNLYIYQIIMKNPFKCIWISNIIQFDLLIIHQ